MAAIRTEKHANRKVLLLEVSTGRIVNIARRYELRGIHEGVFLGKKAYYTKKGAIEARWAYVRNPVYNGTIWTIKKADYSFCIDKLYAPRHGWVRVANHADQHLYYRLHKSIAKGYLRELEKSDKTQNPALPEGAFYKLAPYSSWLNNGVKVRNISSGVIDLIKEGDNGLRVVSVHPVTYRAERVGQYLNVVILDCTDEAFPGCNETEKNIAYIPVPEKELLPFLDLKTGESLTEEALDHLQQQRRKTGPCAAHAFEPGDELKSGVDMYQQADALLSIERPSPMEIYKGKPSINKDFPVAVYQKGNPSEEAMKQAAELHPYYKGYFLKEKNPKGIFEKIDRLESELDGQQGAAGQIVERLVGSPQEVPSPFGGEYPLEHPGVVGGEKKEDIPRVKGVRSFFERLGITPSQWLHGYK